MSLKYLCTGKLAQSYRRKTFFTNFTSTERDEQKMINSLVSRWRDETFKKKNSTATLAFQDGSPLYVAYQTDRFEGQSRIISSLFSPALENPKTSGCLQPASLPQLNKVEPLTCMACFQSYWAALPKSH